MTRLSTSEASGPDALRERVAALEAELSRNRQETQRRFRNMLAKIRAVIRQTGDDVDTLEDYRAQLEGRITSFTRVQSLLLSDHDAGVDLFTLVGDEVLLAGLDAGAIECRGETALLSAAAASLFALLLHELVQGAAIGVEQGRKAPLAVIDREITDSQDGRFLCVHWRTNRGCHAEPVGAAFGWIEDAFAYELGARIERHDHGEHIVRSYVIPLQLALAQRD